ncbi:hypothetical protein EVAR_86569_1 [Eumeta japonica]|uniref:Uncharacterized protein n=1 Tax=Eumeta variegata TaxID=151549 RepID=A0A4C2A1X9_EUMVA|nr:hypothetical protein EVAR_86569_1 [Eumeta japonica]
MSEREKPVTRQPAFAPNGRATAFLQRRKTSRVKSEAALFLAQPTDGSSYFRVSFKKAKKAPEVIIAKSTKSIYDALTSWRKLSQLSVASQGVVVEKLDKAAAPAATKNINTKKSDEADVIISLTLAPRGPKPSPVFVHNKDW